MTWHTLSSLGFTPTNQKGSADERNVGWELLRWFVRVL